MNDLDEELRRVLGKPPPDPHARERALIRLRAQMAEAREDGSKSRHRLTTRIAVTALALIAILAAGLAIPSLRRPAVAVELDRLAQANLTWASTRDISQVRIEEMHLEQGGGEDAVGNGYTGPGFTVIVHSIVTRTLEENDSIVQRENILSADFATAEDERVWRSMGRPRVPQVGLQDPVPYPEAGFDIRAMPTDPAALRAALEDGSVTGYLPNGGQLFESIGSLLADPVVSPEQRVALYHVVESLEGVELLGESADPLGRVGVGFSYMVGPQRQVLIFDRNTGQPFASEQFSILNPGVLEAWQAYDPPSS